MSFHPAWKVAPGEIIAEELAERGWSVHHLAFMILRMPTTVAERLLAGTEPLTPEIAERLASGFGTSVEIWMGLERAWREEPT